jgi:beta-phosphoglucomutase
MISAIVFDFDGVIADSEVLHLRAYQQVLTPLGAALTREDYFERYLGFDDEGVFRKIAADRGLTLSPEDIEHLIADKALVFEALESTADMLFPGAAACVRRLSTEFELGIASGARRSEIDAVLERAALGPCFRAIVASGDTPESKPSPDPYLRAASLLGRAPQDCVAIEDSRWGIASAKAAGMACVGITQTYPRRELGEADHVIDSLDEFTAALIRSLPSGS